MVVESMHSLFSTFIVELLDSSLVCCTGLQYFDSSWAATIFSFTKGDLKAVITAFQVGHGSTFVFNQCFNTSRIKSEGSEWSCLKQSSVVCVMSNSIPILYQLARTGCSSVSSAFRVGSVYARRKANSITALGSGFGKQTLWSLTAHGKCMPWWHL